MCKSICSLRNCKAASMKEQCTPPTMVAFKGWTETDLESSCCCGSWTPWMASLLRDSHVLEHYPAEWPPCDAHHPCSPQISVDAKDRVPPNHTLTIRTDGGFCQLKNTGGVLSAGAQGPSSLLGCCRIFSWCWVFSVWPGLTHWMLSLSATDQDFSAFWAVSLLHFWTLQKHCLLQSDIVFQKPVSLTQDFHLPWQTTPCVSPTGIQIHNSQFIWNRLFTEICWTGFLSISCVEKKRFGLDPGPAELKCERENLWNPGMQRHFHWCCPPQLQP